MKSILLLLPCLLCFSFSMQAQNLLLWDGETNQSSCNYSYGNGNNAQPYQGNWCFEGIPDPWHQPGIDLQCSGNWRINIEDYDVIRFYAKADQPGKTIHFSSSAWPNQSRSIDITPYINGGALTTNYEFVEIPIDSLKTTDYPLNSVESFYFGTAPSGHSIFIDQITVADITPASVNKVEIISSTTLKLTVDQRYDTTAAKNLANYELSSNSDPNYQNPQSPVKVGIHYFVDDFAVAATAIPIVKFELFLVFSQPITNSNYQLTIDNIRDIAGNDFPAPVNFPVIHNDETNINGSVKVNQEGYLPVSRKYAYIGNYLGSAGSMEITPTVFELRNISDNSVVLSGTPNLRGYDPVLSGEKVYDCEFTTITTPGEYYIYVPGIGRSHNFNIGNDVYNEAFYVSARGLYFQRCGTALPSAHAGPWAHAACHMSDGIVHPSCANTSCYNGEVIGSTLPMRRGWHDAGDYGRYIPSAMISLYDLFSAYELYPEKFPDDHMNIPESGNGIPDILDEAKWQTDWFRDMQAADGGVYYKITTTAWAQGMPEDDLDPLNLAEKTTFSTAHFAAVMARTYRVFKPFWPVYADTCLARAIRAWNFLEAHPNPVPANGFFNPPGIGGGEYPDPDGDIDERGWAAAELYHSTGDIKYSNAFDTYWTQYPPQWGWNTFQHSQKKASWTYSQIKDHPVNPTHIQNIKTAIQTILNNNEVQRSDNNLYRCAYRSDVPNYIGWGSYGNSTEYAWEFIKASYLLNDPSYLEYGKLNLDAQLGNNPQSMSYITGIGDVYPMDPLHHPSDKDNVVEPVPGIPVFGPHAHMTNANPYNAAAQSPTNLWPIGNDTEDEYPLLRRYFDNFELVAMSEFTIETQVIAAIVFGFYSDLDSTSNPPPPPPAPGDCIPVWDGEVNISNCTYEYGNANTTEAFEGAVCFEGIPDPWHRPSLNLQCVNAWRMDISSYDYIRFYAKADQPGKTFDFRIYGWPFTSNEVNIDQYIDGGSLTTSYKEVLIPISELKTVDFPLDKIEVLHFGVSQPGENHHIFIDDIQVIDLANCSGTPSLTFDIKAALEGPYDNSTGMTNELYQLELLPGMTFTNPAQTGIETPAGQPYSIAPWNYPGTEGQTYSNSDYDPTSVDWVLLSLRTGVDANTEIHQAAGILKQDGSIEFLSGSAYQGNDPGPYYILIEHRNHIGVLSAQPVTAQNSVLTYDFTTQQSWIPTNGGFGQKELTPGFWGLFAADGDQIADIVSYDINGADRILWSAENGFFMQYLPSDFDLNGEVTGADRILWNLNTGINSSVPK